MIDLNRIISLTNEFLDIPSSISYEKPFLDYLQKKAENLGYDIFRKKNEYLVIKPKKNNIKKDKLEKNNIKKNKKDKYLFSVHIDRHSVIKNEKNDLEFLAFYLKKKLDIPFLKDQVKKNEEFFFLDFKKKNLNFEVLGENIIFKNDGLKFFKLKKEGFDSYYETIALRYTKEECISYNQNSGEKLNSFKLIRNFIDVSEDGVYFKGDKQLDKEDKIFMMKSQIYEDEKYISGQIDNVISVACLFYLLETMNFEEEIIFTTKEEIGLSYICVVDYIKNYNFYTDFNYYLPKKKIKFEMSYLFKRNFFYTHKLIVLDTSPYFNLEKEKKGFLTLRKGDEYGEFDLLLLDKLKNILQRNDINFDIKTSFKGKTELGKILNNINQKISSTTLQLPTMNYHTIYETCSKDSLHNFIKILKLILEKNK